MNDWAKNLKVGDKVIVTTNMGGERISTVQGITPKCLIKVDGMLFYQDGSQRTTSWYFSHINEYTEEKAEQLRQKAIIRKAFDLMRNCDINKIDYDSAVKIIEILTSKESEDTE